jgi:hypothetical protein
MPLEKPRNVKSYLKGGEFGLRRKSRSVALSKVLGIARTRIIGAASRERAQRSRSWKCSRA